MFPITVPQTPGCFWKKLSKTSPEPAIDASTSCLAVGLANTNEALKSMVCKGDVNIYDVTYLKAQNISGHNTEADLNHRTPV